ncbi:hypothetical protein HUJ05_007593 [Dendroctonus ponderosae]|nr:hypothetical protein HUJ05_007593 [Dendroctonus ponderosae]
MLRQIMRAKADEERRRELEAKQQIRIITRSMISWDITPAHPQAPEHQPGISYKQIPFLVIGDFNSKNEVWGGNVTNRRGTELLAWCNLHSLTIINDGLVPTLWKVLKDPDITEHKFIVTKLTNKEPKSNKRKTRLGETNIELLIKTFKEKCQAVPLPISVPEMTTLIRDAYHECTPRVLCNEDYQMPFWWSEGIQTAIQEGSDKKAASEDRNGKGDATIYPPTAKSTRTKKGSNCDKRL